eukprot:2909870-Rhodomonas_salina.1
MKVDAERKFTFSFFLKVADLQSYLWKGAPPSNLVLATLQVCKSATFERIWFNEISEKLQTCGTSRRKSASFEPS